MNTSSSPAHATPLLYGSVFPAVGAACQALATRSLKDVMGLLGKAPTAEPMGQGFGIRLLAGLAEKELAGTFNGIEDKALRWLLPILLSMHETDERIAWLKSPADPYWGPPLSEATRMAVISDLCVAHELTPDFLTQVIKQQGSVVFLKSQAADVLFRMSLDPAILPILEKYLVENLPIGPEESEFSQRASQFLRRILSLEEHRDSMLSPTQPLGAWLASQQYLPMWATGAFLSASQASTSSSLQTYARHSFESLLHRLSSEGKRERADATLVLVPVTRNYDPKIAPYQYVTRLVDVAKNTQNHELLELLFHSWIFHPSLDQSDTDGVIRFFHLIQETPSLSKKLQQREKSFSADFSHPRLVIPRLMVLVETGNLRTTLSQWVEDYEYAVNLLEPQDLALLLGSQDKSVRLVGATLISRIQKRREAGSNDPAAASNSEELTAHAIEAGAETLIPPRKSPSRGR